MASIFHTLYSVKDMGYSSPCWVWNGIPRSTGYGAIGYDGKGHREYAHRVSWEIHRGNVPVGKMVLHKCDIRLCVNPDHLFVGTGKDNAEDKEMKERGAHPVGEATHNHILTATQVEAMRNKFALGASYKELMKEFECSGSTVWSVTRGRTWWHVSGPLATGDRRVDAIPRLQ